MKTILASLLLLAPIVQAAEPVRNPLIDYAQFRKIAMEVQPVREQRRVTEEQFATMSAKPGTVGAGCPECGQVCVAAHSRRGEPAFH